MSKTKITSVGLSDAFEQSSGASMNKMFVLVALCISILFFNVSCAQPANKEKPLVDEIVFDGSVYVDANEREPDKFATEKIHDVQVVEKKSNRLLCIQAENDWKTFSKKAVRCEDGDSCVMVGFYGNCDCAYGPSGPGPDGAGLSINTKYYKEAKEIEGRYFAYCETSKLCIADVLPSLVGVCKDGICYRSKLRGCF